MEHIEKVYGNQVRALHDISLEVRAGEFVAVIGPSGSGKSTLLRTVNQLVVPSGGHVYIDGEEVTGASGKKLRLLRRKVGMIFQHYNLVQRLSVMQNVLHGRLGYMSALDGMLGNYTEEDKRKAIDLLQEIEMGDRLYNRASDLSGGQKQRVGIARAIMQEPKLLLCDEPIASLDPNASKIIMDLIYQMTQRRNIACIVNLHQLDVAMRYATRIIGLAKGEMIFDGTPQQLNNAVIEKIYNTSMENLIIKQGEKLCLKKISIMNPREKQVYTWFLVVVLVLFCLATYISRFNPLEVLWEQGEFWKFLFQDFLPPRFNASPVVVESILVTFALAVSSSFVAAVFAFLFAVFGSTSLSPWKGLARTIRGFATFLRNIPTLVWAFILFSSLGIGTGVGFIALLISTFAFMTRAFIEVIDEVSCDAMEGLTACGGTFWHKVCQGIVPTCLTQFIAWFLYCIELNIRASTIVGMVGGGGIGLVLFSYIKSFNYAGAAGIILVIAAMVIMVEFLTNYLRRKVLT